MKNKQTMYTVTIEIDVAVKHGGLVADNPESVAAAVRQYLRVHLPPNTTKGGYLFYAASLHAEAKPKEIVSHE